MRLTDGRGLFLAFLIASQDQVDPALENGEAQDFLKSTAPPVNILL